MREKTEFFTTNIKRCKDWKAIAKAFEQLPKASLRRDEDGEPDPVSWIFRGHKLHTYRLKPSIERETPPDYEWSEIEYRLLREIQSRAALHVAPSQIPAQNCKLSWLAFMQHHGTPTRLLDFTHSPYVALYFALRHREANMKGYAEVWAIDAVALQRKAESIILAASREAREDNKGEPPPPPILGSFMRLQDMSSALQRAQADDDYWYRLTSDALNPPGFDREYFNRNGLVSVALPPRQNLRLSSQQGLFLFNAAEDRSFESSLEVMMRGCGDGWYKRFQIPKKALREIEEELFRMNVHDLSLFPDLEGLSGLGRQRVRLHW